MRVWNLCVLLAGFVNSQMDFLLGNTSELASLRTSVVRMFVQRLRQDHCNLVNSSISRACLCVNPSGLDGYLGIYLYGSPGIATRSMSDELNGWGLPENPFIWMEKRPYRILATRDIWNIFSVFPSQVQIVSTPFTATCGQVECINSILTIQNANNPRPQEILLKANSNTWLLSINSPSSWPEAKLTEILTEVTAKYSTWQAEHHTIIPQTWTLFHSHRRIDWKRWSISKSLLHVVEIAEPRFRRYREDFWEGGNLASRTTHRL